MTTYIYSRVSTVDQNSEQQGKLLAEKYAHDYIVEEKASGKDMERPKFQALVDKLTQGDTLIVYDISRIGRQAREVLEATESLKQRGVHLIIHTLGAIDITSPTGQMMLTVFSGFAQMEREMMLERQRIGIERAKAEGKYKGRSATNPEVVATAKRLVAEGLSVGQAAKQLKVGQSTMYRLLKEA